MDNVSLDTTVVMVTSFVYVSISYWTSLTLIVCFLLVTWLNTLSTTSCTLFFLCGGTTVLVAPPVGACSQTLTLLCRICLASLFLVLDTSVLEPNLYLQIQYFLFFYISLFFCKYFLPVKRFFPLSHLNTMEWNGNEWKVACEKKIGKGGIKWMIMEHFKVRLDLRLIILILSKKAIYNEESLLII